MLTCKFENELGDSMFIAFLQSPIVGENRSFGLGSSGGVLFSPPVSSFVTIGEMTFTSVVFVNVFFGDALNETYT